MVRVLCRVVLVAGLAVTLAPVGVQAETTSHRSGGEPSWTHGVVRTGPERDAIKSLPITARPYRPLHFYGNTVRRLHYRGTALPAPRDVVGAGAATVLRK